MPEGDESKARAAQLKPSHSMHQLQRAQNASGLKWAKTGVTRPRPGEELNAPQLAAAIFSNKLEFTQLEWVAFGICDLHMEHYIKVGNSYFKPSVTEQQVQERLEAEQQLEMAEELERMNDAEAALEQMFDEMYAPRELQAIKSSEASERQAFMTPASGSSGEDGKKEETTCSASKAEAIGLKIDGALAHAEFLWQSGQLDDALQALLLLAGQTQSINDEGVVVTRIALLYEELGDLAKALEFHFRRLELALKEPFSDGQKAQIRCYDNIAYLYLRQGKDVLFKTYSEKSTQVKTAMLRFTAETRNSNSAHSAISSADEHAEQKDRKEEEEAIARKRRHAEDVAREEADKLNLENEGLVEVIAALKVPQERRDESDIYKILSAMDSIGYLQKRTNEHQRRELARLARYETHIEAFSMYEPGEKADRAWIILGCTPFLEDYKGSVDIMGGHEVTRVVQFGNLFGEDALDGATTRTEHAVVSDDGHDDVITTNHFLTIMRTDFEEVINAYYHDCFEVHSQTRELDCKYANLGDAGVADLSWFLINSKNKLLRSLDLQLNNIGPEGAHRLADLMADNHAITALDLGHNHIADLGVTGLCTALASNTTLMSLSLCSNKITNRAGPVLQKLLDANTVLTSLNLKENTLCYAEAVAQLSQYAAQHNYSVHGDKQHSWSLLRLAQSREERAARAETELAMRKERARGLSASTASSSTPSESSSLNNGWKDRQKRYGFAEESYAKDEIEAIIQRLIHALRSNRNYQYRSNLEGPGVLKRECLNLDVGKRRTMTQRDFIQCLAQFDAIVSPDDAADLALAHGYLPYRDNPSARSSLANTPATGSRVRRTTRENTPTTTRRAIASKSAKSGKTESIGASSSTREKTSASRALSAISAKSDLSDAEAQRPNDLLIAWPFVVHQLEGDCTDYIKEFFIMEDLDRSFYTLHPPRCCCRHRDPFLYVLPHLDSDGVLRCAESNGNCRS